MTEQEWLTGTDPQPMLEFLRGKASDRKLRLFAVACCWRIWDLLTDKGSRDAVQATERVLDGKCSQDDLAAFVDAACDAAHDVNASAQTTLDEAVGRAADACVWSVSFYHSNAVEYAIVNAEAAMKMSEARGGGNLGSKGDS